MLGTQVGPGVQRPPSGDRPGELVCVERDPLTEDVGDHQGRAVGRHRCGGGGGEHLGRAREPREPPEAADGRQDQVDLVATLAFESVNRAHPLRVHRLAVVVDAVLTLGRRGCEEPRVVPPGSTLGREEVREEPQRAALHHEVLCVEDLGPGRLTGVEGGPVRVDALPVDSAARARAGEQQTGLLERLADRSDPEGEASPGHPESAARSGVIHAGDPLREVVRRVVCVDGPTREDVGAAREDGLRAAPEHEHLEVGRVAQEHHGRRVSHQHVRIVGARGPVPPSGPTLRSVDPRRALPSVEQVLASLGRDLPHALRARIAREALDAARRGLAADAATRREIGPQDVLADAAGRADELRRRLLGPVLNATGVLLHTNLGRAPLGEAALAAIRSAAGATNLEYRLDTGERGSRHDHAGHLLAEACGAEAGLVVNNNAAAVLLVLAALARGREVLVSRGELVEIGGGFRVPDVMAESGARLVEVGTTNRTRLADYSAALTDDTAIVLRVHASNYRMVGFVESAPVADLATLGVPVVVDAGSGLLDETTPWLSRRPAWLRDEPGARQCIEAGASLVTFSGDKLLGGPQAGVIVGRRDLIDVVARHPLARAVRADKLTLAALQAVALAYLSGDSSSIPLWLMATATIDSLHERAEAVALGVRGAKVVDTEAAAGGGSLPGLTIPSIGVAVQVADARDALAHLRSINVVAIAREGAVIADLRGIDPGDDPTLTAALATLSPVHDGPGASGDEPTAGGGGA